MKPCPVCRGKGWFAHLCTWCRGLGRVQDGNAHHVGAIFDGQTMTLYVDGRRVQR